MTTRVPLVAGNWKMNKTARQAVELVEEMLPGLAKIGGVERVICPPFIALSALVERLRGTDIRLGAQHMHWEESGAFTGEISPVMVAELCTHVIAGHSERRTYFGETDQTVNARTLAGLRHGLVVIVCVGETLAENEAGQTTGVVRRQVTGALVGVTADQADHLVIAYEPVWAIGTGRAATPSGANAVVAEAIRPAIADVLGQGPAGQMRVLYGGSVTAAIAADFFGQPEIDGALVGGASLKAHEFTAIVQAASPGQL
jgi:triosephosphate isomerase